MKRELHALTVILMAVALLSAPFVLPPRAQGASPQPPRLSISRPVSGSGHYRLVIQGEPDQNYVLEASPNLQSWVSLTTNRTSGGGTVEVTDSPADPFSPRFYRALRNGEAPPPPIDTVWFDDAVPTGAVTRADGGDNPDWTWVTNNPTPFSGTRAHQSSLANADHWHLFIGASATLRIETGDVLFSYIYIDPAHVPAAILLEWYGDNFEHRAYWGANKFSWGTDGTASRRYMGPLPAAGQWVRLEVPASSVGLEGQTLSGMGFELWDGQATWDYTGKSTTSNAPPPALPAVTVTASDLAAAETGPDSGAFTFTRTGETTSALTVNYTLGGTAQNGSDYQQLQTTVTIPVGSSSAIVTVTPIDDAAAEGNESVIATVSTNAAYTVGSPDHATVTIVDNEQTSSIETVWVDDAVPAGGVIWAGGGDNTDWNWVTNNPAPFSGTRAHQSSLTTGEHYHYFAGATDRLSVEPGDVLFTYVYLDPDHIPAAILLQWYDGSGWEHRAYWGADRFSWGTIGTASRRFMGALPAAGQWARLEVPASQVDLEGMTLSGMAFDLWDGLATWDYSGKSTGGSNQPPPLPTVTVTGADGVAGEAGPDSGAVTISRAGDTNSALTVNYTLGGTAQNGTDYQQLQTSVTIPAGSTSAIVTVTPIDDSAIEGNETVMLTLSGNAAYAVGSPDRATVVIVDDDQPPPLPTVTVTASDAAAAETAPDSGTFTIARTGDTTSALTVSYTLDGTAENGTDYQQLETSVTIPAGSSSAIVTVTPIDDSIVETNETVILTLSANEAYIVASPDSATVTIADNDEPPPPPAPIVTVTASDAAASETGPDSGTFTVTRTGDTTSALTVNYTLNGTAQNGTDYQQLGSSVTIPAGSTSAVVTVTPIDDSIAETNETVILTLSTNAAYTVGSPEHATVTIVDNDQPPPPQPTVTVIASDASASEFNNEGEFTISRSNGTNSALTVQFTLGGTAINGTDYVRMDTTVTIPVGATSVKLRVRPFFDLNVEGSEAVILRLAVDPAYTIGSADTATVTISDF